MGFNSRPLLYYYIRGLTSSPDGTIDPQLDLGKSGPDANQVHERGFGEENILGSNASAAIYQLRHLFCFNFCETRTTGFSFF